MERVLKKKKSININLVSITFNIKNCFSYIESPLGDLKYFLVNKFTCARFSFSYIGNSCSHFKSRIEEHIKMGKKFHIFKHLLSVAKYFESYNSLSFKIIDNANSKFDVKINEALHIN